MSLARKERQAPPTEEDLPRTWKVLGKKKTENLEEWVKNHAAEGTEIHIGTDSIQLKHHTQFITVVIIITPSKGGRVLYSRRIVPRIESLRQRLLAEVWESLETSMAVQALGKGSLTIHIDANTEEKHMSSKYIKELVGMVVGNGFQALVKPDAWAATACADYVVRHHGLKRVK